MEVYVVWGFLGSGKTTFIGNLLEFYLKGRRVAILENESGERSVDEVVLGSKSYAVRNLKAGSCRFGGTSRPKRSRKKRYARLLKRIS